jgi:hypothetical protein
MKILFLIPFLLLSLLSCDDIESTSNINNENNANNMNNVNNSNNNSACSVIDDTDCIEIYLGESIHHYRISDFTVVDYEREGETLAGIRLSDLIDSGVTDSPDNFRYQVWGSDGYTFGGYASWSNMQNGYMELDSRTLFFELSQELPDSYNVKDSHKITLSPAK